jgi:ribonucleotide monophosphatase NagD (HAD superfamily)
MAAMLRSAFGFDVGDPSVVMIGDQPDTDGKLAERLGIPFGLVDSGVTPAAAVGFDTPVAVRSPDLVTLVQAALG